MVLMMQLGFLFGTEHFCNLSVPIFVFSWTKISFEMDDFDSLMASIGEKTDQAQPHQEENSPKRPVATSVLSAKNKKGKKQPLAKMRPRVKCSLCEFTGREGQEMRDHMKKEHQTEFKCKECQFRTKYKIVRRRHIINAHKKRCERCDHVGTSENDLNAHKQAEHGILMSSVGFMLTNSDPVPHDAEIVDKEHVENGETSAKKRKTKTEYLKEERQVKPATKSTKDVTRSFKDQFLTSKKNISNLQIVHGAEAEFVLIVKNNIQKPGGKNSAPTAGKYMVACQGNMREALFSTGIKFGDDFVMMANDHDMQITKSP